MKSLSEYWELVELLTTSLATAAAVAVGGSQVGTFVLTRKEGLAALALPQVVAVGVAVALREGWPPIWPAIVAAGAAVLALGWSKQRGANHWVLPSLYVAGLSVSFLVIANAGAHVEEMQQRFTGIDVAVDVQTAMVVVPVVLGAGLLTSLLWRRWVAIAQAPAMAELAGLKPARWDIAFLCLLTTVLLFGTAALGAVMVLAMLFLPAATALPWAKRMPGALWIGGVLGLLFLAAGFVISVEMEWPLSHSVSGTGVAAMGISYIAYQVRQLTLRKSPV
ncbi:MAG TPA: metal ABC transporter permease [Phycisphaerales bacterium]|nr:metal ABC transporter permease [Phycisphaerales bacterium]